jgi:fused signal recognition particle receptor
MALWKPFGKKETSSPAESGTPTQSETPEASVVSNSGNTAATESDSIPTDSLQPAPASEGTPSDTATKSTGMFGWAKSALKKTVDVLNTDIRDLVKEGRLVDDEFLDELFADLVKTDMGVGPAGKIRDGIQSEFRGRKLFMSDLANSAKRTITEIMHQDSAEVHMATSGPTVIMVVGVNGAGKTTSIAKLAHRFNEQGKSVVLGAGDTFRAAAVEQLTIWASRMGAEIITGRQGSDPASVAYKAVEAAKNNSADVCIVDTAGRLQTQSNLMEELGRIRRVTAKVIPDAPHEVLLVLDATAGQNAISQARGFSDAAGCTGIILAKLDGTAKGGVAIPIREEFGLPVKFVGLGETPDAFAPFDVDQYVNALFDVTDE